MPTIYDVATKAGVSTATVSRVLSGSRRVAAGTQERVRRVAEELGYRPNRLAQSLAGGRTHAIGLVLPQSIQNPFYSLVIEAVSSRAREQGFELVFSLTEGPRIDDYAGAVRAMEDRQIEAVIVVSNAETGRAVSASRPSAGAVTVVLGCLPDPEVHAVTIDEYGGGVQVTQYLLSIGHEQIAFVGYEGGEPRPLGRESGYAWAMAQAGLEPVILRGEASTEGGRALASVFAAEGNGWTAAFAYSDSVAWGFLAGLNSCGVRVPGDVSVVGFDDLPMTRVCVPALTTVVVPAAEMGRQAVDLALRLLTEDPSPWGRESIVLPLDVVLRQSTAAPSHKRGGVVSKAGHAVAL